MRENGLTLITRLNTKIEARHLQVVDLVKDLSDGVSHYLSYYSPSVLM